jgi:NADH-quinone oxidoreductase subunit H
MNDTIVSYLSQFEGHKLFVSAASNALGFDASGLITFVIFLVSSLVIVGALATVGGLGTYAERKISADLQMRHGPNRVGPYGLLQFLADGVKMLMKEDIVPAVADKFLFTIAPVLALVGVLATFAVLPFSSGLALSDLNVGVFYLLGISSLVGVAVFLGGYSSNSKWSMLGGMRGAAQIISYEIPVTLSILGVVVLAGGMSFGALVGAQGAFPHTWFLLHNPFTFIGFFVYFIGALAETNRAPFDLPEAESELVSGYHTEFTGMRFAFFALAEYMEVFVVCGVAAALFLGGYQVPFGLGDGELLTKTAGLPEIISKNIGQILQIGSFVTKTLLLYYVVIWVRWTLPRLRVDHLMTLCWKYLTPIAMFNLVGCAFWVWAFNGRSLFELLFKSAAAASGAGH